MFKCIGCEATFYELNDAKTCQDIHRAKGVLFGGLDHTFTALPGSGVQTRPGGTADSMRVYESSIPNFVTFAMFQNGLKIGIRLDRHQVTQLVDLLQATQATFLEAWN